MGQEQSAEIEKKIKSYSVDEFEKYVKENTSTIVNFTNSNDENLLFMCYDTIYNKIDNHNKLVKFIDICIKYGVNINQPDCHKQSFFYYVCDHNNYKGKRDYVLKHLLVHHNKLLEYNLNLKQCYGPYTPLEKYIRYNDADVDIIKLMLENGAKFDNFNPIKVYINNDGRDSRVIELFLINGCPEPDIGECHYYETYKLKKQVEKLENQLNDLLMHPNIKLLIKTTTDE